VVKIYIKIILYLVCDYFLLCCKIKFSKICVKVWWFEPQLGQV